MKKCMLVIILMLVLSCQRSNSQRQSVEVWPIKYPVNEIKSNSLYSGFLVNDAKSGLSKKKSAKSFSNSKAYSMWLRYGKRKVNNNDFSS